ncbi:YicC family protein [Rhodoblastus acidophilus]|uniref:YicC family protein n=1 Tax=Candidatus Rhodoblastus alkanivorans TaxID=2954117 RepID=A0ABS9ZAA0_9HYPH|nr:YicC/YloC family endoribonuclease [Candidatus Rhodoblastus alkanivorans]MCI4678299.1 YicC family protein [Candidatus Rhodoblastus alkanivorans]MCI4683557.1 YicC family protein [Candidatus Rhodoblastus alkanivorans]MDI4640872.1 YicC family protein [Rhodoblastus acidophilus]
MTISSMTGFAREAGFSAPYRWSWEIKTVNSKGLDLRLRLPPGFDSLEKPARAAIAHALSRGACYANLAVTRETPVVSARLNRDLLVQLINALADVERPAHIGPLSLDGLLAVRGVVETVELEEDEAERETAQQNILLGLDAALRQLGAMRAGEGATLAAVLRQRLDRIADLAKAADLCPERHPAAVRERLRAAIAQIVDAGRLDEARLHQEAILLAAKADVREELDRLFAHVSAARKLLADGGAVGRRLDFLAQEFGRETNTLCAKSNDAALTAIGLELKVEVEQLREQAQNIE